MPRRSFTMFNINPANRTFNRTIPKKHTTISNKTSGTNHRTFTVHNNQPAKIEQNNSDVVKKEIVQYNKVENTTVQKKGNVLIGCIIKLENNYIGEWINHYKNLGVDKIVIYDNNDKSGKFAENIYDVPEVYYGVKDGFIDVIDKRGLKRVQCTSYNECYKKYNQYYNWIGFFDIDEFLMLDDFDNINDFLSQEKFNDFNGVQIDWKIFDDNDLLRVEDGNYSVLNRFTRSIDVSNKSQQFKTIVRCGLKDITYINPHIPKQISSHSCNVRGERRINSGPLSILANFNGACLNHYITKTAEEFKDYKMVKGGANTGKARSSQIFFFSFNKRTKEKEQILKEKPVLKSGIKAQNSINSDDNNLKVALCAIAKNENLYIREWVEYYKKLGISKIFLYDNNDLNGERFDDVIGDYIEDGFVEVINKRGIEKGLVYDDNDINLQPACYIDCYENKVKEYDWVCFFDIDEFLVFKKNSNLDKFLSDKMFLNANTICVSWEHYDDNNLCFYDNRPVLERFTHKSNLNRHGLKSIVRTNKKILNKKQGNLIHLFHLAGGKTVYADGTIIGSNVTWLLINHDKHTKSMCVLNHYKTKTVEEYLKRHLNRHWGTGHIYTNNKKTLNDCIDDYFKYNQDTVEKRNAFKLCSLDKSYIKNELIKFGKKYNLNLNLDNPKTIQDKINWLKFNDCTDLKTKCCDKIKIHDYSIEKLGVDLCIPIIKTYNNVDDINFDELPNQLVIKCNHGFNMNIICKDKSKMNRTEVINKLREWLKIDFGFRYGLQLQYHNIDRKILVEKYMSDSNQKNSLFDYKFWCFNGEPKLYTINSGNGHGDILYYDMNDNPIDLYKCFDNKDLGIQFKKPNNFNEMVGFAKKLSEDFKFVRVDFYEINGKTYLGELTFTPGNGMFKYKKDEYSKIIGDYLTL